MEYSCENHSLILSSLSKIDSSLNIDCKIYGTVFCVGEQASHVSPVLDADLAFDIEVGTNGSFKTFDPESYIADITTATSTSTSMDYNALDIQSFTSDTSITTRITNIDARVSEMESNIGVFSIKTCASVHIDVSSSAADSTIVAMDSACGPTEGVISASDMKNLGHTTLLPSHCFSSSGQVFSAWIFTTTTTLCSCACLLHMELSPTNRKPEALHKGRPKVKSSEKCYTMFR